MRKTNTKQLINEKDIEEFNEYCTNFIKKYFIFTKKIFKLRSNMIDQLGEVLISHLLDKKIKIKENQLGIEIEDGGINILCHVNKKSSIKYEIIKISFYGKITVQRMNDHLNLIDHLLPLIEKLFIPQNFASTALKQKKK